MTQERSTVDLLTQTYTYELKYPTPGHLGDISVMLEQRVSGVFRSALCRCQHLRRERSCL